jgi:5'-nucleotidase / UDP-sugar diphosphatase
MSKQVVTILLIWVLALTLGGTAVTGFAQEDDETVTITVINTSDEHGWIGSFTPFRSDTSYGGAAMIYNWWVAREGYDPADDSYLLISGGDGWTGPPISTWFEGEPMVELMNWMGYDASAIGNHEFDFGRAALDDRIAQAEYPYLGANVVDAASGELAEFTVPYTIVEAAGVQVGIIGLSNIGTPQSTNPKHIPDLAFTDYASVLAEYVPQMREEGAEIVLALTHACPEELVALGNVLPVDVDAMFAGHCHELMTDEVNGIPIVSSGAYWRSYARLTLEYDPAAGEIVGYDAVTVPVEYPAVVANRDVLAMVAPWQDAVQQELGTEIGYIAEEMPRGSWLQANWVTDAWLWGYPQADVAITNFGGLRQEVPAGPITVGEVVGVLPFENRIVEVKITGAQLAENLALGGGAVGGIRYRMMLDGEEITEFDRHADPNPDIEVEIEFLDGREFDPEAVYSVLINDFMFAGGDGYLFGEQDPAGYDTGIQWRQPVIDWMVSLGTSPDDPLENYLDPEPRGPVQ